MQGTILTVTMVTVAASIVPHGVSAAPGAAWSGKMVEALGRSHELKPVGEIPTRRGKTAAKPVDGKT